MAFNPNEHLIDLIVNALAALVSLAIVGVIYAFACAALIYLGVA